MFNNVSEELVAVFHLDGFNAEDLPKLGHIPGPDVFELAFEVNSDDKADALRGYLGQPLILDARYTYFAEAFSDDPSSEIMPDEPGGLWNK